MLNFHQSLPFLNWLFPLLPFRNIVTQEFPARFSHKIFRQEFSELDPDWLAPHHPIPNAKFPPIIALLNRPTYHKSAKVSKPRFLQILWEPQINELADSKRASNNQLKCSFPFTFCHICYRKSEVNFFGALDRCSYFIDKPMKQLDKFQMLFSI